MLWHCREHIYAFRNCLSNRDIPQLTKPQKISYNTPRNALIKKGYDENERCAKYIWEYGF